MNTNQLNTVFNYKLLSPEERYIHDYEEKFVSTESWAERLKYIWKWVQKLKLWGLLGSVVRGIGCILFVSPPIQERIEEVRVRAMQYRGIF